jgi:hypothetical protein
MADDRAMKGGIDFNSGKMDLEVKNNGGAIRFNLDPATLQKLENSDGFTPVILNIAPLNDLPAFLGVKKEDPSPSAAAV